MAPAAPTVALKARDRGSPVSAAWLPAGCFRPRTAAITTLATPIPIPRGPSQPLPRPLLHAPPDSAVPIPPHAACPLRRMGLRQPSLRLPMHAPVPAARCRCRPGAPRCRQPGAPFGEIGFSAPWPAPRPQLAARARPKPAGPVQFVRGKTRPALSAGPQNAPRNCAFAGNRTYIRPGN